MSSLFNYVINSKMAGARTQFWGKYDKLDNAFPPIPSAEAIHNYQLAKLQAAETDISEKGSEKSAKFQKTSDLLINQKNIMTPADYDQELDRQIAESIHKIFDNIKEMRTTRHAKNSSGDWKSKEEKRRDVATMQHLVKNLANELKQVQTSISSKNVVFAENLEKVERLLTALEGATNLYSRKGIKSFFKTLSQLQGDLLEEIGTDWFNARMPQDLQIQMITTGNVALKGHGQIIQDLIAINIEAPELDNMTIKYTLGKDEYGPITLRQFLEKVQTYNGEQKITLQDNAYQALLDISVLSIQAKSGEKQLPWNVNSSTQVAISEYANESDPQGHLSVIETFRLLYALDKENPADKWVSNDSELSVYFQALANYGLATVLYKVLHLDVQKGNQYLLTPDGFMLFSQRFIQLFKNKPNGYATISGQVFSAGHLAGLGQKYPVTVPYQWL